MKHTVAYVIHKQRQFVLPVTSERGSNNIAITGQHQHWPVQDKVVPNFPEVVLHQRSFFPPLLLLRTPPHPPWSEIIFIVHRLHCHWQISHHFSEVFINQWIWSRTCFTGPLFVLFLVGQIMSPGSYLSKEWVDESAVELDPVIFLLHQPTCHKPLNNLVCSFLKHSTSFTKIHCQLNTWRRPECSWTLA